MENWEIQKFEVTEILDNEATYSKKKIINKTNLTRG